MKKSFLRLIALNLVLLMAISFPFCAFASNALVVGYNSLDIPNVGENEYVFTPTADGYYTFDSSNPGVIWLSSKESVEIEAVEVTPVLLAAEQSYTIVVYKGDEYQVAVTFNISYHPEIKVDDTVYPATDENGAIKYIFAPEETGWYHFTETSLGWPYSYDDTVVVAYNHYYHFTAGQTYTIVMNNSSKVVKVQEPFILTAGGYSVDDEIYVKPEQSAEYRFSGDGSPMSLTIYEGETPVYSADYESAFNVYLDGEKTYRIEQGAMWPDFSVVMFRQELELGDWTKGGHIFTPQQSGYYRFVGADEAEITYEYDYGYDSGTESVWMQSYGRYYLSSGTEYRIVLNQAATVCYETDEEYELEFATLELNDQQKTAGYYEFTPQESGQYKVTAKLFLDQNVNGYGGGGEYYYGLYAGYTYKFFLNGDATIQKVDANTTLSVYNSTYVYGDADEPIALTFTPNETRWYRLGVSSNATATIYDGEEQLATIQPAFYLELEAEKTYTINFTYTGNPNESAPWINVDSASAMEEYIDGDAYYGNLVFAPTVSGWYQFDYINEIIDLSTGEDIKKMNLGELEAGKTYGLYVYGAITYLGTEDPFEPLTFDGQQKGPGHYTFTLADDALVRIDQMIEFEGSNGWSSWYDEELGKEIYEYRLNAGTYKFYAQEFFNIWKKERSVLEEGYNGLSTIHYEIGQTTQLTFTPKESGWHLIEAEGSTASGGDLALYESSLTIYKGEEQLATGREVFVELQAGVKYDVDYFAGDFAEGISIKIPDVITGSETGLEAGEYLVIPQKSGYYSVQNAGSPYYSIRDMASGEDLNENLGAYYLEEGSIYKVTHYNTYYFDFIYEGATRSKKTLTVDDNQKTAGLYTFTPTKSGAYRFDNSLQFVEWMNYTYEEETDSYVYIFLVGETYEFFALNSFTVFRKAEVSALRPGNNYLFEGSGTETTLTICPTHDSWYGLRVNGQIKIYDGNTLLEEGANGEIYLTLEGGKTYDVKVSYTGTYADIYVAVYQQAILGEELEYYDYFFTPAEDGYYDICASSIVEAESLSYVEGEFGLYLLEAGKTYLFEPYGWSPIEKVEREYLPLKTDGTTNDGGYYTFAPQESGGYVFSREVSVVNYYADPDYNDATGEYTYHLSAGETYKFYSEEPFTVQKLAPATSLVEDAQTYIYDLEQESVSLSFVPQNSGWYCFDTWSYLYTTTVKEGNVPVETVGMEDNLFAELTAGTEYSVILDFDQELVASWDVSYASIWCGFCWPTDVDGSFVEGAVRFEPTRSGYYYVMNHPYIYNAADGELCEWEIDTVYLEQGKTYLLRSYYDAEFSFQSAERTYRSLVLNQENPAGYYKFTPAKTVFYGATEHLFGGGYGGYGEMEFFSHAFVGGKTYYLYSDEPFRIWDLGEYDYQIIDGKATVYGYCGTSSKITVPATLGGKPVAEVYDIAQYVDGPLDVVFSEGIESFWFNYIGAQGQTGTESAKLVNVVIPDSVDWIGEGSFYGCKNLVMTIPVGLDFEWAFDEDSTVSHVFFKGNAQQWEAVKATDATGTLAAAKVHLNASEKDYRVEITKDQKVNIYCDHCAKFIREEGHQHTGVEIVDTAVTCGKPGASHKECKICKYVMEKKTLPATGKHTYSNNCDTTCNVCGATRSIKHSYSNTCDTSCNVCGAVRSITHSFGAYVYNEDATSKADGTQTRTCTVCKHKETVTAPGTKIANPFVDLVKDQYYVEPVLWAVGKKITTGTAADTFSPEEACTRGQIVTFLWRAAGEPEPKSSSNPFWDVPSDQYYYKAVLWAVENGITTGTSAGTFEPESACTRGQIVTFLHRAKGKPAGGSANPFYDIDASSYYYSPVLWAVENGITTGTSAATFEPESSCTRAQIVTFLYRAYK